MPPPMADRVNAEFRNSGFWNFDFRNSGFWNFEFRNSEFWIPTFGF